MQAFLTYLPVLIQLVGEIPNIRTAWNSAATGGMSAVNAVLQKTNLVAKLADIGSALFPKLDPALHAAAAALVVAHPNNTSWAQSALNLLADTGYIQMTGRLVVDGHWGPRTMLAVEALQTKLGLPVNGFIADAEYNAISGLLAKV